MEEAHTEYCVAEAAKTSATLAWYNLQNHEIELCYFTRETLISRVTSMDTCGTSQKELERPRNPSPKRAGATTEGLVIN